MSNQFDEVRAAVQQARDWQRAVDQQTSQMAGLIAGRLRAAGVSHSVLCDLKRELADYNMHTGTWKKS